MRARQEIQRDMTPANILKSAQESVPYALEVIDDTILILEKNSPERGWLSQSLARSAQLLDSITTLSHKTRYQDVWALCRVICELCINTSYLQIADKEELERWLQIDLLTHAGIFSRISSLDGIDTSDIPFDAAEEISRRAAEIKAEGLFDRTQRGSWSKFSLEKRAGFLDNHLNLQLNITTLICQVVVKQSHAYIHSTPRGIGIQRMPNSSGNSTTDEEVALTAQGLTFSAVAACACAHITRSFNNVDEHPLTHTFKERVEPIFLTLIHGMNPTSS